MSRLVQRFLRPPRHFESGEGPGDEFGAEAKEKQSSLITMGFLKWSTIKGVIEVVPGKHFYQFVLLTATRGRLFNKVLN